MHVSHKNMVFWISFILLILASYLWRMQTSFWHLDSFEYDEGIHLILGKLWSAGYIPYKEIFSSYPPIFFWSLGVPWKLFNQVSALRLLMTTYTLLGVVAIVYLGIVYHSRLAGIAAGIFLSFTPAYFIASMQVMGEVPSVGVATVAIALAEKYRRSGAWVWALLVGGALAFSLSLKILPFYAVPLVSLMVISRYVHPQNQTEVLEHSQQSRWRLIRDLFILAAGFVGVFILPLLFLDTATLYEQVIGMRLVSREAQLNPFESNNKDIIEFLFNNAGLMALALYGLVFVVGQNLRRHWLLLVWFIFIWVSMYFHVPLRGKHLPIFLPILALFAGFAISHIFDFIRHIKNQEVSLRVSAMIFIIFIVAGMFSWRVPQVIAENNGDTRDINENEERANALDFINKIAMPDDCVIADNPVFLYQTHRLPPPELSETSQTRIDTGYLTLQDIQDSIQAHNCHVVAVVTPRFGESIPGLSDWLTQNYLGLYAQSETFVYFAKKGVSNKAIPTHKDNFGNRIQLDGSQLSTQPWNKENPGFISLYWRLTSPLNAQYIEHITFYRTTDNETVHQTQRFPFEGQINPANWPLNEPARDTFRLDIPPNLSPGSYNLYLSLCNPETSECLSINHQADIKDLYLGQVAIQP